MAEFCQRGGRRRTGHPCGFAALAAVWSVALIIGVLPAAAAAVASEGCDFDGDGYDDLAVGVPGEELGSDEDKDEGAVAVTYGSADRLDAQGNQLWRQGLDGLGGDRGTFDSFGYRVDCGDFDDDGYSDLVVGSPFEGIDGKNGAGQVDVIYGSSVGLTGTGSLILHREVSEVLDDAEQGDEFGYATAIGDFNGDGHDDLAVGVHYDDPGGVKNAGSVQVFFGADDGLAIAGNQIWHRDTEGLIGSAHADDELGYAVAAGDFDGDGYDDLAMGVPSADPGGISNGGLVNVVYGSLAGLTTTDDQVWHRDKPGVLVPVGETDLFGSSLTTGDFDGDGHDDLAIGARADDVHGNENAGSVSIIYGSPNGLTAAADQIWHRKKPDIKSTASPGDLFGSSLASADFDGDGADDLLVGVPNDDFLYAPHHAGSMHVLYGTVGAGIGSDENKIWHQNRKGIGGQPQTFEHFGASVAAGDFNGDGAFDAVAGVPDDYFPELYWIAAGCLNVIYGGPDGITEEGDQRWTQKKTGMLDTPEQGDRFSHVSPGP